MDLFPIRLILFIFNYSSDLAFNTIFYSNESISDKYHYQGKSIFLFSFVNNFIISLISSIVSIFLMNIFQYLVDSRGYFEDIFKEEENKMRKNKKYKVNIRNKKEIFTKIQKLYFKIKIKIVVFIFIEFLFQLFFYYFVTAFCSVYQKTQVSWLYDFFISFLISFAVEIAFALLIAIVYIISIRYKLNLLYKVIILIYNI